LTSGVRAAKRVISLILVMSSTDIKPKVDRKKTLI